MSAKYLKNISDYSKNMSSAIKEIKTSVNNTYLLVQEIREQINSVINTLETQLQAIYLLLFNYFPPVDMNMEELKTDVYYGWHNLLEPFKDVSLHDYIINIATEINDLADPTSDNNINEFNTVMSNFDNDTFVGSLKKISNDTLPSIINSFQGSNAVWTFETAAVKGSYYSLPARTITLDLSLYLPFKKYGDLICSGFMWITYIWLLIKRAPSIINAESMAVDMALDTSTNDVVNDNPINYNYHVNDAGVVTSVTESRSFTNETGGTTRVTAETYRDRGLKH